MNAIVIGAGPAGSLAAILLARAGARVTLIEHARFPRDKVCGECLSALGRSVLKRHDLEAELLHAGAIELTHTRLISSDSSVTLDLPQPMLGISRAVLDQHLLSKAHAAGVGVLQPWRVESLMPPPSPGLPEEGVLLPPFPVIRERVGVRARDLTHNVIDELHADYIVLADGRGSFLNDKPAFTGDLGIKTHYVDIEAMPNTITLYAVAGCYGGVAPIEGDRWNVAFSVPAERVKRAGGDVARVFDDLMRTNPTMMTHFANARRTGDWLAAPLPRYAPRTDWPVHVIPLGNAAGAIEPIGGEGMGLALRSAELAVEAILTDRLDRLPAQYEKLWRKRRLFCRLGAMAMSNRTTASLSIDLLNTELLTSRPVLSLIGK